MRAESLKNGPLGIVGPDHLRPLRQLKGNAQGEVKSLADRISDRQIHRIDIVDHLAVFGFAVDILVVASEMAVGPLPAKTDSSLPIARLKKSLSAQTGRV